MSFPFMARIRLVIPVVLFLFTAILPLSARQNVRFSKSWKFYRGDAGGAQATTFNDAGWQTVCLPHTVREELNYRTSDIYMGVCWYRKTFTLPAELEGKIICIEFGAAMQSAEVWLNGTSLGKHEGGYTPFIFDITKKVQFTGTNVLAVRLDNNPSTAFPPGNSNPDSIDDRVLYDFSNFFFH